MQTRIITFNKVGYDPRIDFTKGVCILLVVLTHCIPEPMQLAVLFPLWGLPAVPLFLMIQVFHCYKKNESPRMCSFKKLWKRIILPFVFTEFIIFLALFFQKWNMGLVNERGFIVSFILGGGAGLGSYYPWIYLQFALLLPLIYPLFKRLKYTTLAVLFIVLGIVVEPICFFLQVPEWLYRLLFLRYIFLFYLGYLLAKSRLVLNKTTFLLSVLSVISLLFFTYSDNELTPFIFCYSWTSCHWICYVYMAYLMFLGMRGLYNVTFNCGRLLSLMKNMGKYSYEIFLFQLVYFSLFADIIKRFLSFIEYEEVATLLYIILSVVFCAGSVLIYKRLKETKIFIF